MAGTREMLQEFLHDHHVDMNEMTEDGRFTFSAVECLGACDKAPMMQVNDKYHESLTVEKAKKLLEGMK
jgi:NADH-quinone oxidoreductase subunit E